MRTLTLSRYRKIRRLRVGRTTAVEDRRLERMSATAISVIAIVISGLAFLWTIGWSVHTHRRTTRPRVVVRGVFSMPVYPGGGLGDPSVDVTVTNTGQVPVTISSVAFEIQGRSDTLAVMEWLVQSPRPLSIPLGPGDHWTALVETERLTGSLLQRYGPATPRRLRPVASDPAGGRYVADTWLDL